MRCLMTIQYDGGAYHGWQVQKNAVTVQQTVQDALEALFGYRPAVTGCSRTDSGVHARKYCFHFDYGGTIPLASLPSAVNAHLPDDIAAVGCMAVEDDFHARYSVRSKQYVYEIFNGRVRDPFLRGRAYHVSAPLDAERMNLAAKEFIGTHDFSAFCAAGASTVDNTRTVFESKVERCGDCVRFTVSADGFLYNMVRIMAGTLLYVSQGKIEVGEIADIIASKQRSRAGFTAPACGLYLCDVKYDFEV